MTPTRGLYALTGKGLRRTLLAQDEADVFFLDRADSGNS